MDAMGNFIPMRMWTNRDELWGKIGGRNCPQVIHPQSTGGVDRFWRQICPFASVILQVLDVFNQRFDDVFQLGIFLAVAVDFVAGVHDRSVVAAEYFADFGQ